ncbi:hypothetical protein [Streptomyces adustus]|uniref:hypothetical protein n=1 Tax=Streptomyces adustus TaxID=1609272 RepID=UPI003723D3F3
MPDLVFGTRLMERQERIPAVVPPVDPDEQRALDALLGGQSGEPCADGAHAGRRLGVEL